jgi:hypothetical protein
MPRRIDPRVHSRLDILHYEVRMLNRVLQDPGRDPIESNARLESFLLHARNLLDFIGNKGARHDYLTCTSFKNRSGRPMGVILDTTNEEWASKLTGWINKHLSHMTTRRLAEKPDWNDLHEIRSKINALLISFIQDLDPAEFGEAGESGRREFLTLLGQDAREAPVVCTTTTSLPEAPATPPRPGSDLALRLQLPMEAIANLCRKYHVSELSVFGSTVRADFGDSDVDLLVRFKPEAPIGLEFVQLQRELSEVIGRDVDLVPKDSLKAAMRERVLSEAQVLYAA